MHPNDESSQQRYREKVEALLSDVFSRPMVQQLFMELSERQQKSMARLEQLQELTVTSPVSWPFHAVQMPLSIERAKGSRVWDADGNEYVDIHLGFGTQALHGHAPDPVVKFVQEQMAQTVGNGYFHPMELELASLLKEMIPHVERFAFLHTGTDATAGAIRLARAYTGKRLVVKFEGSIIGSHDLGVHNSMMLYHGHPMNPFPPARGDGIQLRPFAKGVSVPEGDLLIVQQNDPASLAVIEKYKSEIACVISESIQSGFPFEDVTIPFTKQVSETCKRLGVLFVLDEVLTGFRCGFGGAAAHYNIHADMMTYGKVLSGLGIPLSAIGGRAEIMEMARTSGMAVGDYGQKTMLGTTHASNHLALCASYASLKLLKDQGPAYYENTRRKVRELREKLAGLRKETGAPITLLGFGDFVGSFFFLDETRNLRNARDVAFSSNILATQLLALMLRRRGVYAYSLPYFFSGGAHSDQDLALIFDKIRESVLEMKKNDIPMNPISL